MVCVVVNIGFKNNKTFFINIDKYQNISNQIWPFLPVLASKITVTWPGSCEIDMHEAVTCIDVVFKIQLSGVNRFWDAIKSNFDAHQKWQVKTKLVKTYASTRSPDYETLQSWGPDFITFFLNIAGYKTSHSLVCS